MKVLGIIAEYNPFHNGHLHHLNESKSRSQCTHTIAVMSGHFLQRGEPALMDKWSRARSAVHNGIDLVLELPFAFSCQSAEPFAYGGIRILQDLNVVDTIAFGSETNDLTRMMDVAAKLAYETPEFKSSLHRYLKEGLSYPKARELALKANFKGLNLPASSNDILGIEYLKWLIRLDSSIKPLLIPRYKVDYHSTSPKDDMASATYLRNQVWQEGFSWEDLMKYIPKETLLEMERYLQENKFNRLDQYLDNIRLDLMRTSAVSLLQYSEIKEGLENKLRESIYRAGSVADLIHSTQSKRYTYTRISRILCHLLHHYDMVKHLTYFVDRDFTPYIRVLAFNNKGRRLLRSIRAKTDNPIITNVGRSKRLLNKDQEACLDVDILSSNLYFTKTNPERIQEDYYRNPEYVDI
ncbi:nucleotidyltransferase [Alkalibacter rhizosphaerae]|uniref:tRNA(Met) cytidine acetate ligase n=1 Tax=Alkalibacter rhizosphaerae TaxID=2815577 RepID=A0A974XI11_9FIRM|nr:nucleotidyltransferase [Alkalibacter rhizosphaerae]QSX08733.1 nucleotidyltransferase [Alkalibacter rhizosphaerae]